MFRLYTRGTKSIKQLVSGENLAYIQLTPVAALVTRTVPLASLLPASAAERLLEIVTVLLAYVNLFVVWPYIFKLALK